MLCANHYMVMDDKFCFMNQCKRMDGMLYESAYEGR